MTRWNGKSWLKGIGLAITCSLAILWVGRVVNAEMGGHNCYFQIDGTVVDAQNAVVNDAIVGGYAVTSSFWNFPNERIESSVTKANAGRFHIEARSTRSFSVQATCLGIGESKIVRIDKTRGEFFDWLGRRHYHAENVVLVLEPQHPDGTQ